MVLAVIALAEVPLVYASAPSRAPTAARLFSAGCAAAIGIAAFVYSVIIRKRFARGPRKDLTNR